MVSSQLEDHLMVLLLAMCLTFVNGPGHSEQVEHVGLTRGWTSEGSGLCRGGLMCQKLYLELNSEADSLLAST